MKLITSCCIPNRHAIWCRYDNHISLNAEAFASTGFTLAFPVINEGLIRECIQVVIDQNIFPRAALPV
jgi:hypothetical protein